MNMNNKNVFSRIWKGIKVAWNLCSLPVSVNNLHSYPLWRIFIVIGSIPIVLFLSSPSQLGDSYLYFIIFTLAMLHYIYIIGISFIKICYIVYLWKNKKLKQKVVG